VTTLAANQYEIKAGNLVVDDTYVYWIAHGILRTRKDGTGTPETLTTATGTGLSLGASQVYFSDGTLDIQVLPKTGGTPSYFVNFPNDGYVDMVSDGQALYVLRIDSAGRTMPIYRVAMSDASVLLLDAIMSPSISLQAGSMAVDPAAAYTSYHWDFPQPYGNIKRSCKDGTKACSGYVGLAPSPLTAFAPASCGVIANQGSVQLATAYGTSVVLASGNASPVDMVFDDGYLYWSDSTGKIGKVAVH
jgi:hypothetical protein